MSETKNWNQTVSTDVGVVRCPFAGCNARIIARTDALNDTIQVIKNSPTMLKTSQSATEDEDHFFHVGDVWDFDNIGVSRPAAELEHPKFADEDTDFKIERLLICSECDRGPLGFAGFFNGENDVQKLSYFLSCSSVVYTVENAE